MKLSLMTINLTRSIMLDESFQLRTNPDFGAYEEIMEKSANAGFDAVDICSADLLVFGTEAVASALKKYGLKCASVICFENYTSLRLEESERVQAATRQIIDGCEKLGARVLMLVAAGAEPGQSREENCRGLVGHLKQAVNYAKGRCMVCVEDFPSTEIPMSSVSDMRILLNAVPGLGMVYDTANMLVEGEDPMGYFHAFAGDIRYYHLKDVRLTEKDGFGDKLRDGRRMITTKHGRGVIDFAALSQFLFMTEYNGYLSVEYAEDPEIREDPWITVRDEKLYLDNIFGIDTVKQPVCEAVERRMSYDPSDANRITREYLDSILFEEHLVDAVIPEISFELFGETFTSPIMTPAFSHLLSYAEGRETGMVEYSRAAKETGILNWAGMMEDHEFQKLLDTGAKTVRIVKPYADRVKLLAQLRYAEENGAFAVGIDIDHVFDGKGNYDLVFGEQMNSVTQNDLRSFVDSISVPFVVKGILSVSDAVKCADCGVKGIVVSHHHGRLPFAVPPVALLPEIREALKGSGVKIFADCHIDTGIDAYKAIALGADAVSAGRALIPDLKKDGVQGAVRKIKEMNGELMGIMSYTGMSSLKEIDRSALRSKYSVFGAV